MSIKPEQVLSEMQKTVEAMETLAKALERKQQRINKTTQSDNASLEQQIKKSKPNENMMRPEQTQTTQAAYEFAVDTVNKANQRDTTLFKRLRTGWSFVGEEEHGPSMVKMTFTRKKAN